MSVTWWQKPSVYCHSRCSLAATYTHLLWKKLVAIHTYLFTQQRQGQRTVLFVDEVHRFNKAQQDAFLPHVESGVITLLGATTENPSFSLNSALLSRSKVVVLNKLTEVALGKVLRRALQQDEQMRQLNVELPEDVCRYGGAACRQWLSTLTCICLPAGCWLRRVMVMQELH